MLATPCPTPDELAAFGLGQLGLSASEVVAEHVLGCPHCQVAIEAAPGEVDPLVATLRKLPEPSSHAVDRRFEAEIAELSASGSMAWPPIRAGESGPPPERLGEYRIVEKLGEGGMGTVYRAVHSRLDKVVALKVLGTARKLTLEIGIDPAGE